MRLSAIRLLSPLVLFFSLHTRSTSVSAQSASECSNTMSALIRKIPSSKLGVSEPHPSQFGNPANERSPRWTNPNWLKSRFHFAFAEYHNPSNQNFGVLRVMNDDLVQPNRGFGAHPHRDVEICTYVVEGSLTHQDSMGTQETLGRGAVQFMSAGRGVRHTEHNLDPEHPLRFIQMWINTRQHGLDPQYGSFPGDEAASRNQWHQLVSDVQAGDSTSTPIKINQDANIFATRLDAGATAALEVKAGRQGYLLCVEGSSSVNASAGAGGSGETVTLEMYDAAELFGPASVRVAPAPGAAAGAHLLLVEMAATGGGRKDL